MSTPNPYAPWNPPAPFAGAPAHGQPHAPQYSRVPPAPAPQAPAPDAPRARTPWLAFAGMTTAAALAASLATAGLTGAFSPDPAAPVVQSTATEQESVPVSRSDSGQPDWQVVAADVRESVVAIEVRTAQGGGEGSGVLLDSDGHILTNDHVVRSAVRGGLRVTLADGRVFEAELVGTDPSTDLAVIALLDPPSDLVPSTFGDSDALAVGDPVMAVGNPLGLDSTVTTGIVSALDRPVTTASENSTVVTNAIQVDAAINPGNSGGPLFDADGRVVGINSSIAALSGGASGSIGLGFAIPSALAERVAGELVADGEAEHAFLGVSLGDGTGTAGGETRRGAVVGEVVPASPAAEAGLEVEDVVVAVDGEPVSGAESLTARVREHAAGEDVVLTVVRDGERVEVEVTLAVRAER